MKLVLIMVLLVTCLMTVAGAFLINSIGRFYLNEFYSQMREVFEQDRGFWRDLTVPSMEEENAVVGLQAVLSANMGMLGVDGRNRNYFILDATGTQFLAGSNEEQAKTLRITNNILTAVQTREAGFRNDLTAQYMDVAVPIQRGETQYILYILDNRQTVQDLSGEMFVLIIESLGFGLVISILLSFLLSKTMIVPLRRLTEGAEHMAEGECLETLSVHSQDEIGILTNTFNKMAEQLQTTIQVVENEKTKLAALFRNMTDGVVAFNRRGEVIHANPAAEEMLARSIPLGGSIQYDVLFGDIFLIEDVLALENDALEHDLQAGKKSLHLLFARFSREAKAGVLVVIHDVTQQVKTETMRREFVANVSHELRTPLTNIRSYAETLADADDDMPPDMKRSFFEVILNESDRMTHIVQDLLTLSRLDSDRAEFHMTVFGFGEVLWDLYQAVRLEAERRTHRLSLDMPPDLPEIYADRERILQVLMNITSNALKYTPDGGEIQMTAGTSSGMVWVEVKDNGIGIPPSDRERIFERFYRVDKARSRESGGTGLGLSIAKEIVNRHGGELSLVDTGGRGTTLRLALKTEANHAQDVH